MIKNSSFLFTSTEMNLVIIFLFVLLCLSDQVNFLMFWEGFIREITSKMNSMLIFWYSLVGLFDFCLKLLIFGFKIFLFLFFIHEECRRKLIIICIYLIILFRLLWWNILFFHKNIFLYIFYILFLWLI